MSMKLLLFLMRTLLHPDQEQSVVPEVDAAAAVCPGSWQQSRMGLPAEAEEVQPLSCSETQPGKLEAG